MKICIVTLYGEFNYGNRLQNYALQKALESLGHEVSSLAVIKDINPLKRRIKKFIEKQGNRIRFIKSVERKRQREFSNFNNRFITTQIIYNESGLIPEEAGNSDCYIVGSDQVWNPLFWEDRDDTPELYNYLLSFTDRKKISYAASFGIANLSKKWQGRFKPLISRFDAISVREKDAVDIVSKLGKSAEVVLDPTLLLSPYDWRSVESNKVHEKNDYILLYFLGKKPDDLMFENDIEVIDLLDEKDPWYTSGPDTFVELIDKASIVYTDSFHATVFSIIFHTPFVVYNRMHSNKSDMSGRVRTLLAAIGIEEGLSKTASIINYTGKIEDEKLEIQREKSISFLRRLLMKEKQENKVYE